MDFYSFHSIADPESLVREALQIKNNDQRFSFGKDKTLALVFLNPSLRTRMSTQEAGTRMGMQVICFNSTDAWSWEIEEGMIMNSNKTEHIKDAARVISQYADIIALRCFAELKEYNKDKEDIVIKTFMKYAEVPVINMESAALHPLQSLADMITIAELKLHHPPKIVLSWAPHPKSLPMAVANSFAQWANGMHYDLTICHPPGYELDSDFIGNARVIHNQEEAFADADIIYTKSWTSRENYGTNTGTYNEWTIDRLKMDLTNEGKFMHCLPIRRNVVATDEVLDGKNSLIIPQAKNRLFSAQVVIKRILETLT